MATLGQPEAEGLVALIVVAAAGVLAVRGALASRARRREERRMVRNLEDFEEREEINRLRHRDFGAFVQKLNDRRARFNQPPLTREYLLPRRFDLMYSVDGGDIDSAGLEVLKKRVEASVKSGEDPVVEPPIIE